MFFHKTNNEKILRVLKLNAEMNYVRKEELKEEPLMPINFNEFNDYINDFLLTFVKSFPNHNYSFLIHNINSLDIYIYTNPNVQVQGHYAEEENDIILIVSENQDEVKEDLLDTLTHELLHLASHNSSRQENVTGFRQQTAIVTKNNIGHGLNEGYTEYLNLKYFCKNKHSAFYQEERKLAEKIESIVGQSPMEEAYFDGDLYTVVKKLSKYSTLDESIDIIKGMDKLSILQSNTEEKTSLYQELDNRLDKIIKQKELIKPKVLRKC